ncbi:MAG: hypothetical protein CMP26_11245 [Roseibacillus sp.]|nr:hypothetical protein [Roseibacillus sp.]MBQ64601.1 hypothetical protein [Euryarchaeota archaeon]
MRWWTKNRLILEDRKAGLLFSWRQEESYFGRTLLALFLGVVLFGAVTLLITVEGAERGREFREAGSLTVLTPGSEASRRWLSWAHGKAPDLERWEPEVDNELKRRVSSYEEVLQREARFEALLYPSESRIVDVQLPAIINPLKRNLPGEVATSASAQAMGEVAGRVYLQVEGSLQKRWNTAGSEWPLEALLVNRLEGEANLRIRDLLGLDRRFMVSVDDKGQIQTCQVLDPDEQDLDGLLGRWLRLQRLEPAEEKLTWGRVRIQVEGVRVEARYP